MITIYMDETEIMNGYLGCGAFISKKTCNPDLIVADALAKLSNYPEKNEKDKQTISRGFFHANEDSPNAHCAFCQEINSMKDAQFVAEFLRPHIVGGEVAKSERRKERKNLYSMAAFYSALEINSIREPITVIFERGSEASSKQLENIFIAGYNKMIPDCYERPYIPLTFPKIEYDFKGNKENPGLQICDFLLWTAGRKIRGESDWYNQINAPIKGDCPIEQEIMQIIYSWTLPTLHYYNKTDYDENFERGVDQELKIKLFLESQALIEEHGNSKNRTFPAHALHLKPDVESYCRSKNIIDIQTRIMKVAELYLKLFDTIPLINELTSKDQKPSMLFIKRFMALLLKEDIQGIGMKIWLNNELAIRKLRL